MSLGLSAPLSRKRDSCNLSISGGISIYLKACNYIYNYLSYFLITKLYKWKVINYIHDQLTIGQTDREWKVITFTTTIYNVWTKSQSRNFKQPTCLVPNFYFIFHLFSVIIFIPINLIFLPSTKQGRNVTLLKCFLQKYHMHVGN